MNIRPCSSSICNRVVVKRKPAETMSRGGIHIPDVAQEKPAEGVVVAVGAGRWLDNGERLPPAVKVGDRILFGKYCGVTVKIEGEEHTIIIEQEIEGVFEDEAVPS